MTTTAGEAVRAFVPHPLPPRPPLDLEPLQARLERALLAVGRLDAVTSLLPDPRLFLYGFVRKEAVLSSQIEGMRSSLSDLMLFEIGATPGVPLADVTEVSNCVAALEHGLDRLRSGFPLSSRLLREVHAKLLSGGRGSDKLPGEFRRSQVWLRGSRPGLARFVPPPADAVLACMADLERYFHDSSTPLPALLRAGLVHVQFETIHPFLDGNGRVGRLLITLLLCHEGLLQEPLLYLSLYFKQHREEYYRRLDAVRTAGDWEGWLEFFLEGVAQTANDAANAARTMVGLFERDRARIEGEGRAARSAIRVHQALRERPLMTVQQVADRTGLSFPTASSAIQVLARLGIVREMTGKQRNRVFGYHEYLAVLWAGTEID